MTKIYGSPDYAMGDIYGSPDYALGAADSTGEVKLLQQQVNRFVPSRFSQPIPVNGAMNHPLATYAAAVLFDRAKRAFDTFGAGEGPRGTHQKMLAEAQLHLAAPLPWVPQNIDQVTKDVANYANFLGLPPASGALVSLVSDWRVWAVVGIGALYYMNKRKR